MPSNKNSRSPAYSPEMDPGLWSQLPENLLELVLTFLPLKKFFTLRSTCNHFYSLIFSPPFISKHSSSPLSSFLLLSHPQCQNHLLYDTTLNTWRKLALPLSPTLSCAPLLSSSGGILCFSLPNCTFLVYNLLARSSRVVKSPEYPFAFEVFTLISTSDGYKIFLHSNSGSSSNVFVYDSGVQEWGKFEGFRPILGDNYHKEGIFFNGCLFFATQSPFSVVGFDFKKGNWEDLGVKMPNELTFVRLAGNGKRLFLFGGIGNNGISRSMKVWELVSGGNEWVEIGSVPELMCRKFGSICYHNYEHIYCFGHEDMICVCCYTWPEVLYYKVSRKTWHWLPKSPSLPDKWSCGFKWFPFVPHLYAFV